MIAQPPRQLYILDPLRGDNTHIFDWFTGRISSSSSFSPLSTTICVLHVGEYTIYRLVYSLFVPDRPQFTPDQLTRDWKKVVRWGRSIINCMSRYHMTLLCKTVHKEPRYLFSYWMKHEDISKNISLPFFQAFASDKSISSFHFLHVLHPSSIWSIPDGLFNRRPSSSISSCWRCECSEGITRYWQDPCRLHWSGIDLRSYQILGIAQMSLTGRVEWRDSLFISMPSDTHV